MWILANKKYCEQVFLVYTQQLGFEYLECITIKLKTEMYKSMVIPNLRSG